MGESPWCRRTLAQAACSQAPPGWRRKPANATNPPRATSSCCKRNASSRGAARRSSSKSQNCSQRSMLKRRTSMRSSGKAKNTSACRKPTVPGWRNYGDRKNDRTRLDHASATRTGHGGTATRRWHARRSRVFTALVCSGGNAEIDGRHPQPACALRHASGRPVFDRSHRSARESATRSRRPDSRDTDRRAASARAAQESDRRFVGYGARAGRPRHPAEGSFVSALPVEGDDGGGGGTGYGAPPPPPSDMLVLRLYVT